MITIDNLIIEDGLVWLDRQKYDSIESQQSYLQGGSLVIEEFQKLAGRPITLVGQIIKSQLDLLVTKRDAPDSIYMFDYYGDQFNIRFDRSSGQSIIADPVIDIANPSDTYQGTDFFYNVTIKLIEV